MIGMKDVDGRKHTWDVRIRTNAVLRRKDVFTLATIVRRRDGKGIPQDMLLNRKDVETLGVAVTGRYLSKLFTLGIIDRAVQIGHNAVTRALVRYRNTRTPHKLNAIRPHYYFPPPEIIYMRIKDINPQYAELFAKEMRLEIDNDAKTQPKQRAKVTIPIIVGSIRAPLESELERMGKICKTI